MIILSSLEFIFCLTNMKYLIYFLFLNPKLRLYLALKQKFSVSMAAPNTSRLIGNSHISLTK